MDDLEIAQWQDTLARESEARFRTGLPADSRPMYDAYVEAEKQLLSDIARAFQYDPNDLDAADREDRVVANFRQVLALRRKWQYWKRKWAMTDGFQGAYTQEENLNDLAGFRP